MVVVTPGGTTNPNAVKFTLDRPSTASGRPETFRDGTDPSVSPLGHRVFQIDGVTNVFCTADFVSVTKEDDADWGELVPLVVAAIEGHFAE